MHDMAPGTAMARGWFSERILLGYTPRQYVRSLLTPFDLVAGLILAVGIPVTVYRFAYGLGAVTNLSQTSPWGIWIGFDVLAGVALAAGGYTISTAVYVFGLEKYRPVVRPALLTGFLGYLFVVVGLLVDLGSPWRLPVPIFFSFGTTSVMFEVAWCVALYLSLLAFEFLPPVFEWLGLGRARAFVVSLALPATIAGVMLSTLHQSSLGALFLLAEGKIHPLWYSSYIPVFFFVSSIVAGLSMVIVESALSHRAFRDQLDPARHVDLDGLTLGLARGAAVVLFSYFFLKLQGLIDGGRWDLLATAYGAWYLVEVLGFVLAPALLFAWAARGRRVTLVRWIAGWTVLGIVVNRMNVAVIAVNWSRPVAYFPSWMEIIVSLTIVTVGVLTFRWIVNRMPVLREQPGYPHSH
ncbi:MAG TPA: NrfD/PsrC family molybdoenzyme membrane anchor subunit [Vicinamibacterales bacterium]|nr:NrfD/PsrC family molybdoenzyme membrane anchor subunit [Vicinamibacterales bacterium]